MPEAPWRFAQNSATQVRLQVAVPGGSRPGQASVVCAKRAEAWTPRCLHSPALPGNPTLLSTENSLLTVPLGPSEVRNTDMLDKLRQAVGEGQGWGRLLL